MPSKKYLTTKRSVQSSITELEKLEKTHKSELRMISTAAFKFKSKFLEVEDPRRWQGETEASNVRMYETHFPGFCYQKDGKYRRRVISSLNSKSADSVESSEKVKALLFTENELDIEKVISLHLLGTHVHSRRHIQRKDGRLCTFIKSQVYGNRRFTLQAISQRTSSKDRDISSTYDKTLPRYVLEVCEMDRNPSNLSIRTYETDSCSEEDFGKWRKFQAEEFNQTPNSSSRISHADSLSVPIYVNNDIRAIISSVLEALEAVNSPKLKELINLARNPEELRNLLSQEYIQEYIIELAGKQLINNATAYDFSITYPVFEKISDTATTETVAQVLDIPADSGLRNMLYLIRKNISRRYEELVLCNVIPGKKKFKESSKGSMMYNFSRTSFLSGVPSTKTFSSVSAYMAGVLSSDYRFNKVQLNSNEKLKEDNGQLEIISEIKSEKNSTSSLLTSSKKIVSKSLWSIFPNPHTSERTKSFPALDDSNNEENVAPLNNPEDARLQHLGRYPESETSKYDLKSLNNSQRILLGLKVASMKCRPVNMHQFENKKKVDIGSIITSIVHPLVSESNPSDLAGDNFNGPEQKRVKRPVSRIGACQVQDLGNLTRGVLSNFRHDIATTENKKRVKEFMDTQL